MKKQSPKSKSIWKIEQDKHFRKFWLLVKGQSKSQSQQIQVKVNGYMVRVDSRFLGQVTDRQWRHPDDLALT